MPQPPSIGRYQVISAITGGNMGRLYLAEDSLIGRKVAIKRLEDAQTDEDRDRFRREAQAAGRLSHPNIVPVFDVGEDNGVPFIVMEFVAGETLARLIGRGEALPLTRKIDLLYQLCAGLEHAHEQGIIHRDIKPSNLMVDRAGVLRILDFGIAKIGSGVTTSSQIIGTMSYMSPEQWQGGIVDRRSDVFAAGAVAHELLSYRRAFPGDSAAQILRAVASPGPEPLDQICRDVPQALAQEVTRMLARDPGKRHQSMGQVILALHDVRRNVLPAFPVVRVDSFRAAPSVTLPAHDATTTVVPSGQLPIMNEVPAVTRRDSGVRLPRPWKSAWSVAVATGAVLIFAAIVVNWRLTSNPAAASTTTRQPPSTDASSIAVPPAATALPDHAGQERHGAQLLGGNDSRADSKGRAPRVALPSDTEFERAHLATAAAPIEEALGMVLEAISTFPTESRFHALLGDLAQRAQADRVQAQQTAIASGRIRTTGEAEYTAGFNAESRAKTLLAAADLEGDIRAELEAARHYRNAAAVPTPPPLPQLTLPVSGGFPATSGENSVSLGAAPPTAPRQTPPTTDASGVQTKDQPKTDTKDGRTAESAAEQPASEMSSASDKHAGATPPAHAPVPDPVPMIGSVLKAFRDAYQDMNIPRMKTIAPGYDQYSSLVHTFPTFDSVAIGMSCDTKRIAVTGVSAHATCTWTLTTTAKKDGKQRTDPNNWAEFTLGKGNEDWVITSVKFIKR